MTETGAQAFVGVDGGASKTRIVVIDCDADVIGEALAPAAALNARAEAAWSIIEKAMNSIDALANIAPDRRSVVVGIAGTEIETAYRAFMDSAPAFARLAVVSDAHTACAGAHALADGAIVAVGTGVVGFGRLGETTARAGGWGFPHDDCGGGAWLGMKAVAIALAAADGRREPGMLAARVLADFDSTPALSAWACGASAGDFAHYARAVVECAADDSSAKRLLIFAGRHISTVARAVLGDAADQPLALTGGLAQTLMPYLAPDVRARLRPAAHDGAYGAALMARGLSEPDS